MYVLILSIDNLQIPGITVRVSEYIIVTEHKVRTQNKWQLDMQAMNQEIKSICDSQEEWNSLE